MNRRILEDVKINTHKQPVRTPKADVVFKDLDNHNPSRKVESPVYENTNKYDFLEKKIASKPIDRSQQRIPQTPQLPRKHTFSKIILTLFILSLAIGAVYLLSTVFLKANVTVVAKNKSFDLKNQKFTASRVNTNNVPFELMIVSDSVYQDVVLTSSREANDKAKGEITLYNEFSNKPQKIVAGSFLSDEKGKSYKIDVGVTIPGYTMDKEDKEKIIPGQVSVGITSFLPGEAYNGSPESFSINSFKGTTKYQKIYGKTKTPLSGGIVGLVYVLDENEKAGIMSKTGESQDKLLRKLSAQVPEGYILYGEAVNFAFELSNNIVSKTPDVKIELKGTLSAMLLKEEDLSNALINKLLPGISKKERAEIVKPKLDGLKFNFTDKDQLVNKEIESFDFELTGALPINWLPDSDLLKKELAGKEKTNVTGIFKQDPGISSAGVKIMPFWSKKLPLDIKNINIILK